MTTKRHPAITTIAVLHLVLGGLGILCGACGLGGAAFLGAGGMESLQKFMEKAVAKDPKAARQVALQKEAQRIRDQKNPRGPVVEGIRWGARLLLSTMMLVAGFGLLKVHPWARDLSIAYAVLDLIDLLAGLYYTITVLIPVEEVATKVLLQGVEAPNKAAREWMGQFAQLGSSMAIGTAVVCMLYPLAVLVVMFWPSVSAAFQRGEPPRTVPEPELPPLEPERLDPEDHWRV